MEATHSGIGDYYSQLEITISKDYIKQAPTRHQKYLDTLRIIIKAGLTALELLNINTYLQAEVLKRKFE
ncbi:MAG: hypothetical protein WBP08_02485 [Saprospiraceae bacterium]